MNKENLIKCLKKVAKERDRLKKAKYQLANVLESTLETKNELEKSLQTLKEAVREWLKAGDDFATNKINEDKYDKIFYKLKELIK